MDQSLIENIRAQLQSTQSILVISHIRPDGDAVGSVIGFGLALEDYGKRVQMILADGIPLNYRHLIGSEAVLRRPVSPFDYVCVLDCSDPTRMGDVVDGNRVPDLNIDHHVTNLHFANTNIVDISAVSTTEILTDLIIGLGIQLSPPIASALLTGLITDTLGFRTANLTPKALRMAADLMEQGADLPQLYQRTLVNRTFEAIQYWARGLTHLERKNGVVWATLTQADREAVGYPGRDDAELINVISSISDAEIAIIFIEQTDQDVKVSWRARPGYDVSQLAMQFGGGGHPAASGASISGELGEVKAIVLHATHSMLQKQAQSYRENIPRSGHSIH